MKLAKDGCVITFLDNYIFFLGAIHEQHTFKHFKNLMEKFVKFGAMKSICLFFSVIFFGGN